MSSAIVVATMALQGAAVGVSGELALRALFQTNHKAAQVRYSKFFLGFFMAIKSVLFLSFHASQGSTCSITGRLADLFFHFAMTAGTHVLVTRVQSIVPVDWKRKSHIFHSTLTVVRCIFGLVDVGLINIENYPNGTCKYTDQEYWGPVYTLYDTLIDGYVTVVISYILLTHIRSLASDRMKINNNLYMSVIYHNVIRTVCLTIVNLISTILIVMRDRVDIIMLLWPIINIAFVILVGYDSDVTKSIRKLRQRRWNTLSVMASTVDLAIIPSINISNNAKRPGSASQLDVELETGENMHDHAEHDESFDLSLMQIERWKTGLSSTERQIQEQAGYDNREDRRLSLPNLQRNASASYDTDNTLT